MKYLFILISFFSFLAGCESKKDYEINTEKNYEKGKVTLQQTEQRSPSSFLVVEGEKKKNIIGQTVIRGQITNNAKIVSFKDVDVKLSFYSKTGTLLEEDHETVYETIAPGDTKKFKSKYYTPKGTDSVAFKVSGAKF